MKHTNRTRLLAGATFILLGMVMFQACKKEGEDNVLGAKPAPDFEIVQGIDANNIILVNKSNLPTIPYWTLSTGTKLSGDSAKANFPFAGTYEITLLAAGQGGTATTTKSITINQSDPNACSPNKALGFIAGCTQKVWKLNPDAAAYKIGVGPDAGNWWSSTVGDVTGRVCEFNDEYTFVFNGAGTFNYDNKGDFYADGSLGTNTFACEPTSNYTPAQALWASGNFTYTIIEGAGIKGLGQLRVNGKGAHIGLQKVHNGGETASGPVGNSITYDIIERKIDGAGAGHDLLKLAVLVNATDNGWWTFTLRSE